MRTKDGFTYEWKEGAISFPDNLDKPSEQLLPEGGKSLQNKTCGRYKVR